MTSRKQRVDNYAAGFIHAGASAVIAEAWSSPTYMVKSILGGSRSIESAWLNSPSANGNRFAYESQRSPGYVAQMDPENSTSGFTRSIVLRRGLTSRDVLTNAAGSTTTTPGIPPVPVDPTLTTTGIQLRVPDINDLTSAGSTVALKLPYRIGNREALPKGIQVSIRWDPLQPVIPTLSPSTSSGTNTAPSTEPVTDPPTDPQPSDAPAATDAPTPSDAPTSSAPLTPDGPATPVTPTAPPAAPPIPVDAPPDPVDLVVPEQAGSVVSPVSVKVSRSYLAVPVALPSTPGRYRLSLTLHDANGVAYDAATQALLPTLIVRVTGAFDGDIVAVPTAELTAGTAVDLHVRVVNLGQLPWGREATITRPHRGTPKAEATVIGRWVSLTGSPVPAEDAETSLPAGLKPGQTVEATLGLTVPTVPGQYLLLLDIVSPDDGSLVATGAAPTLVRVTVSAAQ